MRQLAPHALAAEPAWSEEDFAVRLESGVQRIETFENGRRAGWGTYRLEGQTLTLALGPPNQSPANSVTDQFGNRHVAVTVLQRASPSIDALAPSVPSEQAAVEPAEDQILLMLPLEYEPNQTEFKAAAYEADLLRAVQTLQRTPGSRISVRGYSDPTKMLVDFVQAGLAKGVLDRVGQPPRYAYKGQPLDLSDTARILAIIQGGELGGASPDVKATWDGAVRLSAERAGKVKDALLELSEARSLGRRVD